MKRKTKKQERLEKAFDEAMEEVLRSRGAVENTGWLSNMYPLRLPTEAGDLLAVTNGTWVAMRFEDVERAKTVLPHGYGDRLNRYTGKYNIHFHEHGVGDLDYCRRRLEVVLEPVLPVAGNTSASPTVPEAGDEIRP